jgi:hypothetical protein
LVQRHFVDSTSEQAIGSPVEKQNDFILYGLYIGGRGGEAILIFAFFCSGNVFTRMLVFFDRRKNHSVYLDVYNNVHTIFHHYQQPPVFCSMAK